MRSMKVIISFLFVCGIAAPAQSWAFGETDAPMLYLGGGAINHNSNRAATSATTGATKTFDEVYAHVGALGLFGLDADWGISPFFYYGVTTKKSPEGGQSTGVYAGGVRALYNIMDGLDVHVGPAALFYRISGKGGTVVLSNGSSTATFGLPSLSKTSRVLAWDIGIGFGVDVVRIDAGVFVSGLVSSSKRAVSPHVTLSVGVL